MTNDELDAIESKALECRSAPMGPRGPTPRHLYRMGLTHGGMSDDVVSLVAEARRLRSEVARLVGWLGKITEPTSGREKFECAQRALCGEPAP